MVEICDMRSCRGADTFHVCWDQRWSSIEIGQHLISGMERVVCIKLPNSQKIAIEQFSASLFVLSVQIPFPLNFIQDSSCCVRRIQLVINLTISIQHTRRTQISQLLSPSDLSPI
ncbi:hypothetical protein FGO68_gene12984 [Halteria grandinella]|uniref:Uncharacterized protein n=1 Tax=Halteria grandinella TaxID=5974 RepID=A0A8J8NHN2_HALGN|nr:hypothetical protein FGO68_gene12984 [Halteria grandinella]